MIHHLKVTLAALALTLLPFSAVQGVAVADEGHDVEAGVSDG